MADTFSDNLKVRLPQTGQYANTWGSIHNSDTVNLLDQAIAGRADINIGSATAYSVAALNNGSASDSRALVLRFFGTPGGAVTATLPSTVGSKPYVVHNNTGQTLTLKYSGSTGVTFANGVRQLVYCDGTEVYAIFAAASDASTLDGIDSTQFARRDAANVFAGGVNSAPFIAVTEAPTTTILASAGQSQILVLTGNRTMAAPTSPADGEVLYLLVVQDGSGGRTLTWNSVFLFENGIAPTLATNPGAIDFFVMLYSSGLGRWMVGHYGNVTASGGAAYQYTIAENTVDWNLLAKVGSPGGAITVNISIGQGVIVHATTAQTPAMDLSGLPIGSTVNLVNLGYVLGKGGDGGDGAALYDQGAGLAGAGLWAGDAGQGGGAAIQGPGVGMTFNITNGNGHIWGGGGGGGGGGASGPAAACVANGGGGGGGAGGGALGRGSKVSGNFQGSDGSRAGTGPLSTFGVGGPGNGSGGSGGAGGDGGDWGGDGVVGVTPGASASNMPPGPLGPAGKAIELSGAAAPTFASGSGAPNVKGAVS